MEINFLELGFNEYFAGINFRELSVIKDFAGVNLTFTLKKILSMTLVYGFENNPSEDKYIFT